MKIRVFIGYFLATGLIASACLIGGPVALFIDIPSALLYFGGTGVLLLPLLAGTSIKNITWLGTPATLFSSVTGMTVVMIGLISLLQNLSDPSAVGPSIAVCVLGLLYTLVFMSLISFPLEDWHNLKHKTYTEVSLSRVAWFLFPITSTFFTLIAMSILLLAINANPKHPVQEQTKIDYFAPIEK